jgi:hypothetical protein
MRLDLRILEHLGINLYSNAAAVVSEAVANAWDADAEEVSIDFSKDSIVIEDDGRGMDLNDVNRRFLTIGYDKRGEEGDVSSKGRPFMGRKGIGKLSLFSLANVIEVHTVKKGERHAFRLSMEEIKIAIKADGMYYPKPIAPIELKKGTKIVLTDITRKRTDLSSLALRRRVARRFSVIGRHGSQIFNVKIDNESVTLGDRVDLKNIEFLWEFGAKQVDRKSCPRVERSEVLADEIPSNPEWRVGGWIGAVAEPKMLASTDYGSLNNIVIISRGRLIQENILPYINYSRLSINYITGVIIADFLDLPDFADIATSDRQRIVEDDERYLALGAFLRSALVSIADQWSEWRNELREKEAKEENPALVEWLNTLPPAQVKPAGRVIAMIKGLQLDDSREDDRKELYRSGIVAFERLRLNEQAHQLAGLKDMTVERLLPIFASLSSLEAALYVDIVRSRLEVIKQFEGIVDENAREKVLQNHLFKNLWLLDTAWERATDSPRIEQRLKKEYKIFAKDLSEKQSKGRYDIKYKTVGGRSVLVELKRAGRRLHLMEVHAQCQEYRSALMKCLKAEGDKNPTIEIAIVVGKPLYEEEDIHLGGAQYVQDTLAPLNARVLHYETLIKHAQQAYDQYLTQSKKLDNVSKIVAKL